MTPRLRPDLVMTETDSGAVLLDQRTGQYWQLNETGAHTLRKLIRGTPAQDIAADFARRYGIAVTDAAADIAAVVERLTTTGLMVTGRPARRRFPWG
ncbi:lasso peptide biosynthesis PqqD family chaperone [Nocardia terpenica]|uniref:PqqD family protein n=1 Tax=Nocardia terpenica TaxID=455432 RepID=A0A291RMG8_9NOCA|nr:lasso peptide biosynthesis PqqD family chaperone [Nocardia terpenica]ATL68801.1 PqqD family protein [Nocardia terpenica]